MPTLAEAIVALLLLTSGAVVLIAASGLWRLPDFFLRMHAPALASTLAAWAASLALTVHFSAQGSGLRLHGWLIVIVLSITGPITTVVLSRAALFRRRQVGDDLPGPLQTRGQVGTAGEEGEAARAARK